MHVSLQEYARNGRGAKKECARDEHDRYRRLVEGLPSFVCEVRAGRVAHVNAAGLELLRAESESALLGRPFADLIAPEFAPILDDDMAEWLAESAPVPLRLRRLDDSLADVEAKAVAVGDDGDESIIVIARDISDLKHAALAIVDQESFLHAVLDNLAEGIVAVDEDGCVITANAAACRMFGARTEDLAGLSFVELVGAAANRLGHVEPCAPAAVAASQVTAHRRDGTPFLVELAVGAMRRAGRTFSVVAIRDVTKEVEARNRARRAEAQFIDAIESVPVGIALFDADDRLLVVNERYRELFSEIAELITSGVTFETMARALVERGAIPDDAGREGAWLRTRLTRHHRPDRPFETRRGDRWLLIREHRTADGGTFTIVSDITERKTREEELRRLERENRLILNAVGEGIYGVDCDGNTTFVNPAAARLTGFRVEELLGAHQHEISHHTRADGTPYPSEDCPIYATFVDGRARRVSDDLFWRKDGTSFPVEYVSTPVVGESGEIEGAVVTFADITERKRSEEAIRAGEARYRHLFDNVPMSVWEEDWTRVKAMVDRLAAEGITDLDAYFRTEEGKLRDLPRMIQFIDFNARTVELYGAADKDEIYRNFDAFLASLDWRTVATAIATFVAGRSKSSQECRERTLDGRDIWVREIYQLPDDDDGSWSRVVVTIEDITQRKRAESDLRRSEAQVRAIMENIADGLITMDEKGIIHSFNAAAETMFGYDAEEVIGQTVEILMPEEIAARHHEYLEAFTARGGPRGGRPVAREVTALHKDGTTFPIELVVGATYPGDARMFIGTMRNISDRKKVETRLRESQKLEALGQLAGGVAHDFNNLLMIINGYTRRALANLDDKARIEDSLAQVIGSTDKAATLTRQLLLFGRRDVLDRRVLSLAVQIDEIESLLLSLLGETIELVIERGEEDLFVETDPGQLHQAIVNLALNARDAMAGGGRIWIAVDAVEADAGFRDRHPTTRPGRYARITVEDNGEGMDEETLARVFEPFFTTKEQGKGTGLGLAMVYGFVKQSEGAIEATSRPGEGAAFSIFLPLTDRAPVAVSETERAVCLARGETVLLVEDDDALRTLAEETLGDLGYRVIAAEDGLAALEAEDDHEGDIDLLLTDVVMPGLGGFEVARVVRGARPDIKIVYMSGYPARGRLKKVDVPDDAPFLQKPFDPDRLARCLRDVLDGDGASGAASAT